MPSGRSSVVQSSPGATLERWPLGGELDPRADHQYWIHGGGCVVHSLDVKSRQLETISPPPDCRTARILYPRVGFQHADRSWQLSDGQVLQAGEPVLAAERLFHHVDGKLIPVHPYADPHHSVPVHALVETPLYSVSSMRQPRDDHAPHPSPAYRHTSTLLIDRKAAGSPFRVRWFELWSGSIESESEVVPPAGARLAAFDHHAMVFVDADNRTVRTYRVDYSAERWEARVDHPIVGVELSLRYLFVISAIAPGVHEVRMLDPNHGQLFWSRRVHAKQVRVFPNDSKLTWARDNVVAQIDDLTGRELWTWSLPGSPQSVRRIAEDSWLASGVAMGTELFRIDHVNVNALPDR